jgi:predicted nucleic acid-binding protein
VRLLLDTNVLLDVLLARSPHADAAVRILAAVEADVVTGVIGATSVTTVFYLATKAVGVRRAKGHVRTILSLFEIAPVTEAVLTRALELGFTDFEDAVIHEAARAARCTGIVTRDATGFKRAELPVYSPTELLAVLQAQR